MFEKDDGPSMFMIFSIALFFIMGVGFVFFMDSVIVASGKLLNINFLVRTDKPTQEESEFAFGTRDLAKLTLLDDQNDVQYCEDSKIKRPDLL